MPYILVPPNTTDTSPDAAHQTIPDIDNVNKMLHDATIPKTADTSASTNQQTTLATKNERPRIYEQDIKFFTDIIWEHDAKGLIPKSRIFQREPGETNSKPSRRREAESILINIEVLWKYGLSKDEIKDIEASETMYFERILETFKKVFAQRRKQEADLIGGDLLVRYIP